MIKVQPESTLLIQSQFPPIEDIGLVETHLKLADSNITWGNIGILMDKEEANQLVILLNDNIPVSVFRLCLTVDESLTAIQLFLRGSGKVFLGYCQGQQLTKAQITCLDALGDIWKSIQDQIKEISTEEVGKLFSRQRDASKKKGRGPGFSTKTKQKVLQYSHGRCMFEGCGLNLQLDALTGTEGNFGYLAHNVASSEYGARGGKAISGLLANDPRNILLLCDKHHRLVDKVAAEDYPATRLSKMRCDFKRTADRLLEGLSCDPLPTYAVLWPVGGHVIASPTDLQISQALSSINARPEGPINTLSDNNELLMEMNANQGWGFLPRMINSAAKNILQQTHNKQHRAALFAFGVMPALIGLGAMLGNKAQIIPMLRFRDSGTWKWPLEQPKVDVINIKIDESLTLGDEEVALSLSLTARPNQFDQFISENSLKEIAITPSNGLLGNGCIGHPEEGKVLIDAVHKLLHQLVSKYDIKKIHFLPCASNAACVFVGKAIDNYHPKFIVYDFEGDSMAPRLTINPRIDGNHLQPVTSG